MQEQKRIESNKEIELKKYVLEIIVFICGAVVMIFELTGSRILAPYLGTSIFVWASLIGVVLGSLSFGYWYGGKIADKNPNLKTFSMIIFFAAILLGFTTLIKDSVLNILLETLHKTSVDIRWSSLIVVIILFAFPSVFLGMVSPYAVKLKMKKLENSGRTVGNLYAISTVGSIVGTFLAGFVLIPFFGSTKILYLISLILLITSIIIFYKKLLIVRMILFFAVIYLNFSYKETRFIDIDTQYNRVWIHKAKDALTGKGILVMRTGYLNSSLMFLQSDELAVPYTKFYDLAKHFKPDFQKTLMLGGAAYSYPKHYLKKYSDAEIDVVEIDPELTELARKYFRLKENPRLNIFHEDGRIFINRIQDKYDVFMCDVFNSHYSLPYQLTTIETAKKVYDLLNEDGVAVINVISSIEGDKGQFLRAEYATYKDIFPQVYLFPVSNPDDGKMLQNVMIVALKSNDKPIFENDDPELNKYLKHLWTEEIEIDVPILTDDYAPVDHYNSKMI